MALIRGHHEFDDQFTQIPNSWLRDPRLSLATKGLLAQIMSHRPGWSITLENLALANGVGRDAIRTCINQLIEVGYLSRSEERERNSMGQVAGYTYVTQDPTQVEPTLAEPTQGKQPHKKTITLEDHALEEQSLTHVHQDELFDQFWDKYPRKQNKQSARRAFKQAIKQVSLETIVTAAHRYATDPNRVDAYTKLPETWLRNECWEDEPLPERPKVRDKEAEAQRSRELLARDRELTKAMLQAQKRTPGTPPPKCEHGNSIVSCQKCLKG